MPHRRITKDMFADKLKELKEEQAEIRLKLAEYDKADEKFYLTANTVLNVAKRALEIFKSSEVPEKRQFLNFLLEPLHFCPRIFAFCPATLPEYLEGRTPKRKMSFPF